MLGHAIERIQYNNYGVTTLDYTTSVTVPTLTSNGIAILLTSMGKASVWKTSPQRPTLGGVLFTTLLNIANGGTDGDPRAYLGYIKYANLPAAGSSTLDLTRSAAGRKMIATLIFYDFVHQTNTFYDQASGGSSSGPGVALSMNVVKGGMMVGVAGTNLTSPATIGSGQTSLYHAAYDGYYRWHGEEGNIVADASAQDFSYYTSSNHLEAMVGASLAPAITPQAIGGGPIFFS